jgi:hypothetical protein
MQEYAKAARELINNVAKLTVRQASEQLAIQQLLPTSASPQARASIPVEARVSRFKQELLASRIDMVALRSLAFHGVPDKDGLRAITWKVTPFSAVTTTKAKAKRLALSASLASLTLKHLAVQLHVDALGAAITCLRI